MTQKKQAAARGCANGPDKTNYQPNFKPFWKRFKRFILKLYANDQLSLQDVEALFRRFRQLRLL